MSDLLPVIPEPLFLYVVQFGERVKVGVTRDLAQRYQQHSSAARSAGVEFEPLMFRPSHLEARANETAAVKRFATGRRSEFLEADARDVMRYVQTLPFTPMTRSEWQSTMEPVHEAAARALWNGLMATGRGPLWDECGSSSPSTPLRGGDEG